ncbi:5-oxoprolinase subunit PxpB [Thermococcus sp.]
MNFKPLGDSALLVSFGEIIDEKTNDKIHSLAKAIEKASFEWLIEVVPAYSSLAVMYDAALIDFEGVKRAIGELEFSAERFEGKLVEIPVVYGSSYGPDLEFVAQYNGLTPDEVIEIHSKPVYRVYFLGFLPGFAYLGGMDERIATPRLEKPRLKVPAGSVGIAGKQTGIYPLESPGGWRIIGRTPLRLFNPEKEPPTLLQPGDRVKFVPIDEEEFLRLYREEWVDD